MYVSFSSGIGKATFKNFFVKANDGTANYPKHQQERVPIAFVRLVCCAQLKSIEIHSKVPP